MTFSDSRIVALARKHFVSVWESVAPARVAVFDLGEGKEVRGTIGGEIALYFCRPDGKVFDVLPALNSPQVTYDAMARALEFYRRTGATDAAIAAHHTVKLRELGKTPGQARAAIDRIHRQLNAKISSPDAGTRDLGVMAFSKTLTVTPAETITVVEPAGRDLYQALLHEQMARHAPKTPMEWKKLVFEDILGQKLEGGTKVHKLETLDAFSIIE